MVWFCDPDVNRDKQINKRTKKRVKYTKKKSKKNSKGRKKISIIDTSIIIGVVQ